MWVSVHRHEQQPHRRTFVSVAPRGEAALTAFFLLAFNAKEEINLEREKEREGGEGKIPIVMDASERRSRARSVSKPARFIDAKEDPTATTKGKSAGEVRGRGDAHRPLPTASQKRIWLFFCKNCLFNFFVSSLRAPPSPQLSRPRCLGGRVTRAWLAVSHPRAMPVFTAVSPGREHRQGPGPPPHPTNQNHPPFFSPFLPVPPTHHRIPLTSHDTLATLSTTTTHARSRRRRARRAT